MIAAVLPPLAAMLLGPGTARATWQNFSASAGGLLSNSVYCAAEDHSGAIWFGTSAGACRFDGSRWIGLVDSLPNRSVFSILEDRQDNLWFGTGDGIARFDGVRWRYFLQFDPLAPGLSKINALLEDHRGDIWAGTDSGLVRFEPAVNRWTTYAAQAGGLVSRSAARLLEDRLNRLWIATPFGVSMLDSTRSQWTTFRSDPNALGRDSVFCLAEDAAGNVWFGTDQGAWRYGLLGWSHWTSADGLPGNLILSMACDRAGRMWFGGINGLSHGDGITFRYDSQTSDKQPIGPVVSLLVDSSGNIWTGGRDYEFLGAFSSGVFRFDGVAWRNYFIISRDLTTPPCNAQASPNIPTFYTLPGNCLAAGLQDRAGDLWFGTAETGVARLDNAGMWSTLRRSISRPMPDSISAILEDRGRTLWFASPGSGIAALDPTRTNWMLHTQASGLPSNDVRTLFLDSTGELWAGTAAGAARWNSSAWGSYVLAAGAEVLQFAEDLTGRLWVRTSQGLFSIDPDRSTVRTWTTADGLAEDYPTAMLAASDGAMWFGTSIGVSRLAQGTWTSWLGNSVTSIRQAPGGDIWVGTSLDARRWSGSSWEVFTWPQFVPGFPIIDIYFEPNGIVWAASQLAGVGRFDGGSWRKLDSRGNGLTHDEVVGVVTDTQNRMWVLGRSGLAEFEPDLTAPQTLVLGSRQPVTTARYVEITFGAAYGEQADLEFSLQWDAEPWTAWSPATTWSRNDVPDGVHTFAVRARDWAGNVDPTPATYTFLIDATAPAAEISSPAFGQPVRGTCAITGTAADPRFRSFKVQARPAGGSNWDVPGAPDIVTLAADTTAIVADTLATWNTSALPDGNWDIRLAVADRLGLEGATTARVIVDNVAPFANVTSPVDLVAGAGGDVFTTNAEVHLYFPPNAFDKDPTVSVDSLAAGAAPDTLPGGAIRRGPAWEIGWIKGRLQKNGVLEMRPWRPGGSLAVWRRAGAGAWTRLGGTPQEGGALALTLDAPGQYAVFAESAPPVAGGSLVALTLTPRAFSPRGGFATADVAIGFSLARPGGATVKLYNRAGRLVRVVANGMGAVAGENLVRWDGRDTDGRMVEAGLYLVTVEALGETLTRPLAVVQ